MLLSRALRVTATSAVLALAVGAVTTTNAEAKPTRPGPVTGLAVVATEPAIGTYRVAVDWNNVANATAYQVFLYRGGTQVATTKITAPTTSWARSVAASPGQNIKATVAALIGHFKGKMASQTIGLEDMIAPTASYTLDPSSDLDTGHVTLLENGLADDSPLAEVTRRVDWGDGTVTDYAVAQPIAHVYTVPVNPVRYVPQVTLKDLKGNTSVVDAVGVALADHVAPTGAFGLNTTTAWASLTKVRVSQTAAVADNVTGSVVTLTTDWGDGTTTTWTGKTSTTHVYRTQPAFAPKVTMTDEALNSATVDLPAVTVKVDSVGPRVKLLLPKSKHSVRAFRTLKGKATDTGGTGVKNVTVKAIEKRGTFWYGYNAKTKTWLKAATKTKALAKARAAVVRTNSRHVWAVTLKGLRKGTLVYRAFAKDKVANKSATLTHKATLTRR